ncbi:MAG: metalloregulator ArsR/SmtB family transcription factor [Phycisphaerae bacterium]|nr:metalloregulator ArsR/SmtB family transcription factor [Phycisphaerae bacterium]
MLTKIDLRKYEKQAEIIKALAHPLRLAVVEFLKDGEKCVCDIAEHIGSERSNVSKHLSLMVNADILECRKDGLKVMYKLKTLCVVECMACITRQLKTTIKQQQKLLESL